MIPLSASPLGMRRLVSSMSRRLNRLRRHKTELSRCPSRPPELRRAVGSFCMLDDQDIVIVLSRYCRSIRELENTATTDMMLAA